MQQQIVTVVLFSLLLGFSDAPERSTDSKQVAEKLPDLSGAYSYKGSEKGDPYQGALTLIGEPPCYRVTWVSDDGDVFRGTALQDGDFLAVGWAIPLGVHPAIGTVMKQGAMAFHKDGAKWRGKWTTGERVCVEEWQALKLE